VTVTHRSFAEQSRKYFVRDRASIPSAPVDSPAAWHGADLAAREQEWRRPFAPAELGEPFVDVDDTVILSRVIENGASISAIHREDGEIDLLTSITGFDYAALSSDSVQ